jgi:hypothetical protein
MANNKTINIEDITVEDVLSPDATPEVMDVAASDYDMATDLAEHPDASGELLHKIFKAHRGNYLEDNEDFFFLEEVVSHRNATADLLLKALQMKGDGNSTIRAIAASNHNADEKVLSKALKEDDGSVVSAALQNKNMTPQLFVNYIKSQLKEKDPLFQLTARSLLSNMSL